VLLAGERYAPHITVGRLAGGDTNKLADVTPNPVTFPLSTVVVARLTQRGAIDTIVRQFRF